MASYKYLGVHQNNKVNWSDNTDVLFKMGEQTPTPVEKQGPLMRTFYDFVVASAIFYGVVCWACNVSAQEKKRSGEEGQLSPGLHPGLSGGGRRSVGDR